MTSNTTPAASPAHPLDPLSGDEMRTAVAILRASGQLGEQARFPCIALKEPPKATVLAFKAGDPIERQAELLIFDRASGTSFEAIVDLNAATIASFVQVHNVQSMILWEEWDEAEQLIREHPAWQEAARKRGITDLSHVMIDPVSAGYFGFQHEEGRRLARGIAYYRESPTDNGYARPIEGLIAIVDLVEMKVIDLWDSGCTTMAPAHGRFDPASVGSMRADLKPLEIMQSAGPSFSVCGNEIRWQKWRMRVSLHSREGLVLHTVGYEDDTGVRPILYRAGLSEMIVPYGDPAPAHFWRGFFDVGEFGLGREVNSLERGCDCLGEIYYFDATLHDERGTPLVMKNAICLHEEDAGILWRHHDYRSATTHTARNRRLVVSSISTIANYDYGFYWYFYQDGSIEHEVKMTGLMQTQTLAAGELPEYGALVAPQLAAMHHQHFFCYRLDMMVDGPHNTVYEIDAERIPIGPDNPYGNAMRPVTRLIDREAEARRNVGSEGLRSWKIVNPAVRNGLGVPVAYTLTPRENSPLLLDPAAPLAKRAAFAQHHLWVTQFDAAERYAAGDYPNQSAGGDGLPRWQQADRPLENQDIVLWYTLGATHFPRPEDWPVMPVVRCSFSLRPHGFFDRNPALDVPQPAHHAHDAACH